MKLKNNLIVLAFHFLLFTSNLMSQNIHVAGVFPTIDHSGTINNKLDYSLYYFAAFPLVNLNKPDLKKHTSFLLFYSEQALSYNVNKKLSFTLSYVFQRENTVYTNYVNENRFYLQTKYKHSVNKINLVHRLRFDGRFIHNRFTNETPFTHRLRYLIGFDAPINEKLYITAYEEAFFNTFKNTNAIYGENWAYVALGKKLNPNNKIEAGALYITWNTGIKSWFNQYYFQLTWLSYIDFRKNN